jgi:3-oxoadipate enol-lactonase
MVPSLAYSESGAGPVLVLLHAFPLDRTMWEPTLRELGGVARVIAVDLPGLGESQPGREPFTIDSTADAVAGFLATMAIPRRVVVCGLSMGGYVAMAFARRHADRLAGLILADTKSEPDDELSRLNRDKMIALANEQGAAGVIRQLLPKLLSPDTLSSRPEVVELVTRIAARQPTAGIVDAIAALRDRPDATPGLTAIAVPTLILVGQSDVVTPPDAAAAMGAQIRGSQIVTIPDAGHLSNLENPTVFNAGVRSFLTALTATPQLANE